MSKLIDRYRIDCPQGHRVSVPRNLLGQDLICPTCNSSFHADINNSAEQQDARVEKAARQWLMVAITAAILLVFTGLFVAYLAAVH